MAYPFAIHAIAHQEYIEAYEWYELKQTGLGNRFMNSVEKRLIQIANNPTYYSTKMHTKFREAKVEKFPYMIVYEFNVRKKEILIVAIYHAKRNPKRKYTRKN